jgi:hypothetical protein
MEKEFVASRARKLGEYLSLLLAHPFIGHSHELVVFLDAQRDVVNRTAAAAAGAAPRPGGGISSSSPTTMVAGGRVGASNSGGSGGVEASDSEGRKRGHGENAHAMSLSSTPQKASSLSSSSGGGTGGESSVVMTGMDQTSLKRIQSRIYAILKELLEIDKTFVRRNLLSFLRKGVNVMLSGTISKAISGLAQRFGSDDTTASFLHWLVRVVWSAPGQRLGPKMPPPTPAAELARAAMLRAELRAAAPATLTSLLGHSACDEAVVKLFEFLQCAVLIRSLLYSAFDLLWRQLFPDDPELRDLYGAYLRWEERP